ncbi:DUF4261 domain-containing protein [Myroides injenensis]|uniref:DUF4261 domain-containing protein n=1 Tax=Myroides injenensis TaxID=1183151 RepID=UPI000474528C|nr:DUF4261 domain-containing protein [Myroides injenensis]
MSKKSLGNKSKMLMFRLLFEEKPVLDMQKILEEIQKVYPNVTYDVKANVYTFPDCKIEFEEGIVPAQCVVMQAEDDGVKKIDDKYLQQNWHWDEASDILDKCKYEVLVTDFLSRSLEPRIRIVLIQQMLYAMTKVCHPTIIVAEHSEKLIDPKTFIQDCSDPNYIALDLAVNVRLFNVENQEEGNVLMDTIGLHSLGLPDFQIIFNDEEIIGLVANQLWNYAYYLMQEGDIIKNGDTVEGIGEGSKWLCHLQWSDTDPKRTVLNLEMN